MHHQKLKEYSIKFRPNKPASPHLNGKVERSQKTDKAEFYATVDLSTDDLKELLASHRLCSASSVWQTVPEHHVPLWQQVSQVEHRPLSACEERL